MININLFAQPGTGKSTIGAGLFYKMKIKGYNIELIDEYAKGLVYSENFTELQDQLMIFANQRHKLERLKDKVHYTINDGPFLLSAIFVDFGKNDNLPIQDFKNLVIKTFRTYKNINIFLEKNDDLGYQKYGRKEDEETAKKMGSEIKLVLNQNNIKYETFKVNENTVNEIYEYIKEVLND